MRKKKSFIDRIDPLTAEQRALYEQLAIEEIAVVQERHVASVSTPIAVEKGDRYERQLDAIQKHRAEIKKPEQKEEIKLAPRPTTDWQAAVKAARDVSYEAMYEFDDLEEDEVFPWSEDSGMIVPNVREDQK
jgi:hypothetical protein